ncbi:3b3a1541-7f5c-4f67-aff8-0a7e77aa1812 [Thermothielavioides terrestris]|uniref:3b3a1541-7f5c-4f67-aff8-0a7e77aa1812 n=1 Tax=Thermothielavioides terrestris TaxID=2587410 RepID=A0A3S4F4X5_9PEZI|nr:3b3a1541-7f5c-4f67-aff8-0a7e77aa1812 [Thermothielavioides terrestris]
MLESSINKRN